MVQIIPQLNPWGDAARNLGQGIGDELKAQYENKLLKSGLESFAKESQNLSPLEAASKLYSIRGITPQMVQTFPELAKNQQRRQFYANQAGQQGQGEQNAPEAPGFTSDLSQAQFGSNRPRYQQPKIEAEVNLPENLTQNPPSGRGVNENNPLNAVPGLPWTQQRKIQELNNFFQQNPNATDEEGQRFVADKEARELALPEAQQRRNEYYNEQQRKADAEYEDVRNRIFQKSGEDISSELDGETDQRLRNAMYDDLKRNPDMSTSRAANKWAQKALDLAKAQTTFDNLASKGILEKTPQKTLNSLKSLQKIYEDAGNSEGFYNRLISDFSLTPQYAALIAYPRSKSVQEFINKPLKTRNVSNEADSVAKAAHIGRLINDNDSLLAIAKSLKDKDSRFDETAFFNELRDNQDKYRLNARQRRELAEGESAFFRSWGDIWLFPLFNKSVVHD